MTKRTCSVEGCDKPLSRRGWCSMHYSRWQRYGDLEAVHKPGSPRSLGNCVIDDGKGPCGRPAIASDLCTKHYQRWKSHGDPLAVKRSTRSHTAEARFRAWVAQLGGAPLYEKWLGRKKGHHVRCANGHDCWPVPANARRGFGLCRSCARVAKVAVRAEAAFRVRLAELGATPLYEKWLGVRRKHHVRCADGHDCYPEAQNVLNGKGVCWTCAGNNPVAAETAFRVRLAELGATPLFGEWLGNHRGHHVRCAAGHDCWPLPAGVQQGEGACRKCRGKLWDAFYVVENEDQRRVKFGVTSGDARPRLTDHRAAGYRTVVRLLTGLPDRAAPDTERAVKVALAMAGEKPVRGTEYFDASCLGLILDVADSWLARGAGTEDYATDSNGQLVLFAA